MYEASYAEEIMVTSAFETVSDSTESQITQTCFALLFLKRSTRKPFVPNSLACMEVIM